MAPKMILGRALLPPKMQSLPSGAPWKSFGGPLGLKGLSWIPGPRDPLNSQDELGTSIQDNNNGTRMASNGAQWHPMTPKRNPMAPNGIPNRLKTKAPGKSPGCFCFGSILSAIWHPNGLAWIVGLLVAFFFF